MFIAGALFLTVLFGAGFVALALWEQRNLAVRILQVLVAGAFTLALGFLLAALGFEHGSPGGKAVVERTLPSIEVESATRWAVRAFGGWLVVLAAGELLRLVVKRTAGTELLGPAVLFLAGALLIDPQWGLGVAFAVGLVCVAAVSVWGRPIVPGAPPPVPGDTAAGGPPPPGSIVVD
jgi:hypothetical protein